MSGPIVVNFFGAPGAGKSTNAAALFASLKRSGVNCELVTEYAKDCVWRESENILKDQMYVFAKQHNRLFRLRDKVDAIITDSPLMMNLIYAGHCTPTFKALIEETANSFDNLDVLIRRTKAYNPVGRMQTAAESDEIAERIERLLHDHVGFFVEETSDADPATLTAVVRRALATRKTNEMLKYQKIDE